jgi:hypothetical protein
LVSRTWSTKLEAARKHYETAGLGADYIERFIR